MERWSSRRGFLLAAVGAAVGLGNIWRFSAVVGQNGGGAYLVPYLFAAFAFAVPLLVLELAVGRALRLDVVAAFRSVRREFAALGWVVTGSVLLILSYYLVLTGWVLAFLVDALAGGGLTFAGFTGTAWPVLTFGVTTLATGAVVAVGVRAGIERMATVAMPIIAVLLLGLAGYGATLPGFGRAVSFLFVPDFSVLGDPLLWSAAFGQVFFSLSVGQGIMLTYGSYLEESTDVARSALLITVVDVAIAVVAGLVIFPVVFSVGLEPSLGTELAFTTLPRAFASMQYGRLVAVAFFGLLFFAALTSSVSLLEVGVAAVLRTTDRPRREVAALLTALVFLVGLPSALSYSSVGFAVGGVRFLDLLDESVGALALPVTATLIAVVFTWYQDRDAVAAQIGTGVGLPLVKYVIPVVLVAITALRLLGNVAFPWQYLGPTVADLGGPVRLAVLIVEGVLLYLVGRFLARRLPSRIRRRRRGDNQR
ncbi:MAG: sodium-dependent transporter [Halobacteriales archaeon]